MTLTIARKEMTEMLRDGRVRWTGGLILLLLAVALTAGWQRHQEISRQHTMAQEATRQHWLTQGKKNPHSAAHYGIYAFKPKLPLALLDTGTEPYTGVAAWLEAHKQNEFKYRPAQDATMLARFGEMTAAMVLQMLVPLLIVMMTFPAFAGERELGTLRQLLSLGVPRETLAAGKALGMAAGLGVFLVPAALLGSGALVLSNSEAAAASWGRAAWLALAHLLYFAAFAGISLAVSAWARSTRLALVALLGFWIFNCLVAPRAAVDFSRKAHPTPSSFAFAQTMTDTLTNGGGGLSSAKQHEEEVKARVLKQYGVDSVDKLPVSWAGISLQAGEDHGNAVFDKLYGELWDTFEQQNSLQRWTGIAAPLLALRPVSMAFSGTDFAQHRHFATAAEEYRRLLNRKMNDEIRDHAAGKDYAHIVGDEFWQEIPPFVYEAPSTGWVLQQQAASLGLLGAWAFGAAALCAAAARRLRVD
jgi:ABC-2 type transport system permease protein